MKILLAVDGSEYTKRMLAYLAAHPELVPAGQEFTAITVIAPVTPGARSHLSKAVVDDYYESNANEILDPVQAFAKQKQWKLSTVSKVGHVAEEIAKFAEAGAFELVVIGSHGRAPIVGVVLGSVVTKLLALSRTPLLIVR